MNPQQYLSENLKSCEVKVVAPRTCCCIIHLPWIFIWDQLFVLVDFPVLKSDIRLFQDEVIMPTLVALSYLKEQNLKKKAYILATPAVKEMFESNNIMCSSDVGVSIFSYNFFYIRLVHSLCQFITCHFWFELMQQNFLKGQIVCCKYRMCCVLFSPGMVGLLHVKLVSTRTSCNNYHSQGSSRTDTLCIENSYYESTFFFLSCCIWFCVLTYFVPWGDVTQTQLLNIIDTCWILYSE